MVWVYSVKLKCEIVLGYSVIRGKEEVKTASLQFLIIAYFRTKYQILFFLIFISRFTVANSGVNDIVGSSRATYPSICTSATCRI